MSWFRSMSVERKLPLLMTAVLAIVMAVAVSVTYRTLRDSAEAAARERMIRGVQTITVTIQDAIAERFARLRDGTTTLGYVAHKRRLGGSASFIASLASLVGDKANLHMRNRANDFWATAPGLPSPRPIHRDTIENGAYDIQPDGTRLMATEVALAGTPWIAVLQVPRASVMARPRAVAVRLTVFGVVLTALGAFIAWAFSRRLTRPLASLSGAAQALADGDHASRVVVRSGDEIGRLAMTFNRMADELRAKSQSFESPMVDPSLAWAAT